MCSNIFKVIVAHVVDREDVDVAVFGDAFLDVGVEFEGQLFAFFGRFGEVHDFCAFRFGHCCGGGEYVWAVERKYLISNLFAHRAECERQDSAPKTGRGELES